MIPHGNAGTPRIPDAVGKAGAVLSAAAAVALAWGSLARVADVRFLFHYEGIYRGWLAKMLLNGYVADPWALQYLPYEGSSVVFGLFLVPVFHFLGSSLFHLALGSVLWQSMIAAWVAWLCWRLWGPRAALWAGLLFVCAPMPYVHRTLQALSNHCEVPLFALLNVLLLWRVLARLHGHGNPRFRQWMLLGVVNGVGLYFSYEHISVILADLLVLIPHSLPRRSRGVAAAWAVAVVGLLIGFSPWFHVLLKHQGGNIAVMFTVAPVDAGTTPFEPGVLLESLVRTGSLFRSAMTLGVEAHPVGALPRTAAGLASLLSHAVFYVFPVATTAAFVLFNLRGPRRRRLTAARGIEAWFVLYLGVHLTLCSVYEIGSDIKPEYFLPLFPVLCVMGGAVLGGATGTGRRLLPSTFTVRRIRVLQALLATAILFLAVCQWAGVSRPSSDSQTGNLTYRGFANRTTRPFFLDPIARVDCERLRLLAVRYNYASGDPWSELLTGATVEEILRRWNSITRASLDRDPTLEPSLPAMAFNLGHAAAQEGRDIGEVQHKIEPVVPGGLRDFLYMGYSYFLRMEGLWERERVLGLLRDTAPGYRHYFLIGHGTALGTRHRHDPEKVRKTLDEWSGTDRGYVAAGVLWTTASVHPALGEILDGVVPGPVHGVLECERLGACSSPFGGGVLWVTDSVTSILPFYQFVMDPAGLRPDMNGLIANMSESAAPPEFAYGAGAALALAAPWKIHTASALVEDPFPEALRGPFLRGYLEAASWLLGGRDKAMAAPLPPSRPSHPW